MKKIVFFLITLLLASEAFSCGLKELFWRVWQSHERAKILPERTGLKKEELYGILETSRKHSDSKKVSNDESSPEVAGVEATSKSKKPCNEMAGIGTREIKGPMN